MCRKITKESWCYILKSNAVCGVLIMALYFHEFYKKLWKILFLKFDITVEKY